MHLILLLCFHGECANISLGHKLGGWETIFAQIISILFCHLIVWCPCEQSWWLRSWEERMVKKVQRKIPNLLPCFLFYFIQLLEENFTTLFPPEFFLSASLLFYTFMYLLVFNTYMWVHNVIYTEREAEKQRKRGKERREYLTALYYYLGWTISYFIYSMLSSLPCLRLWVYKFRMGIAVTDIGYWLPGMVVNTFIHSMFSFTVSINLMR